MHKICAQGCALHAVPYDDVQRHHTTLLQANNKYQEVFTSSIDELDRRILMQGVSYE